jgi:hypothetical protein
VDDPVAVEPDAGVIEVSNDLLGKREPISKAVTNLWCVKAPEREVGFTFSVREARRRSLQYALTSFCAHHELSVQKGFSKQALKFSIKEGVSVRAQSTGKWLTTQNATEPINLWRSIARQLDEREVIDGYSFHRSLNHGNDMPRLDC